MIKTLIQMATQALITKAIMASVAVGLVDCSVIFWQGPSGGASVGSALFKAQELIFHLTLSRSVYDSPSLSAYSNGVYSTRNILRLRRGGCVQQAGPEAIMPLTRGADGSLKLKL